MKKVISTLCIVLVFAVILINASFFRSAQASPTYYPVLPYLTFFPLPTEAVFLPLLPDYSFIPLPSGLLDPVIEIPDVNMDRELREITGVPDSEDFHMSDLSSISGSLDFSGLGIENAEGIQYCVNVEAIFLRDNELSFLPDLSGMTKLKTLNLDKNRFSVFPEQVFSAENLYYLELSNNPIPSVPAGITALTELKMLGLAGCELSSFPKEVIPVQLEQLILSQNPIETLPSQISSMSNLEILELSDTGISELPDSLYSMNGLKLLSLPDNNIKKISENIKNMTSLEYLSLSNNQLTGIPDEICQLPDLEVLAVSGNSLYGLPDDIGDCSISILLSDDNRLEQLPASIGGSDSLRHASLMLNRLTALPSSMEDSQYDYIRFDYNFIDVSAGSENRGIIDSITCPDKTFEPQFKPITGLTASAGPDSVTLNWLPGENGTFGPASWEVKGYSVYLKGSSGYEKVLDLGADTLTYTQAPLDPNSEYSFRVGVDYALDDGSSDYEIRSYTYTSALTLPLSEVLQTQQPTDAPNSQNTSTPEGTVTEGDRNSETGIPGTIVITIPVWTWAVIGGIAVLIVGFIVLAVVMASKRKQQK